MLSPGLIYQSAQCRKDFQGHGFLCTAFLIVELFLVFYKCYSGNELLRISYFRFPWIAFHLQIIGSLMIDKEMLVVGWVIIIVTNVTKTVHYRGLGVVGVSVASRLKSLPILMNMQLSSCLQTNGRSVVRAKC